LQYFMIVDHALSTGLIKGQPIGGHVQDRGFQLAYEISQPRASRTFGIDEILNSHNKSRQHSNYTVRQAILIIFSWFSWQEHLELEFLQLFYES